MKRTRWIAASLSCAVGLGMSAMLSAQQYNPPPQQQPGYGQQQPNQNYGPPQQGQGYGPPPQGQGYGPPQGPGGWDAPPSDFMPTRQQGFRDGLRAAREDFRSGRGFAVTRNPMYRHPPTPRFQRDEYRDGFQRGYDRVMRHRGDAPPPPPPGQYYPN